MYVVSLEHVTAALESMLAPVCMCACMYVCMYVVFLEHVAAAFDSMFVYVYVCVCVCVVSYKHVTVNLDYSVLRTCMYVCMFVCNRDTQTHLSFKHSSLLLLF